MTRYTVPVSAKGIVFDEGKVWLRKNERNEWELPGGKVDEGEQPTQTVVRELKEELGFDVRVERIVQAWMYTINVSQDESRGVLVVSYLCELLGTSGEFEWEGEAGRAQFERFSVAEIEGLAMPEFYKDAIQAAYEIRR